MRDARGDVEAAIGKKIPLKAWQSEEVADIRCQIEKDIGALMYQAASLRQEKEGIEEQHRKHLEDLLLSLLEVTDALDRVCHNIERQQELANPQKIKIWLGNLRTVRRLLEKMMGQQEVTPIEMLDGTFNPHLHQAVDVQQRSSLPDGAVISMERRGYFWRGRLLRKAEVTIVGCPIESKEGPDARNEEGKGS